jgi:HKD family nuclease
MPKLPTLFADGCAVVVGLPKRFQLSEALRSAKQIRLATAFAHVSGWDSLKADIQASTAEVYLLTGLQYNQTEPALLNQWMRLKLLHSDRVNVALAPSSPFFHPKVLIVCRPKTKFAIVGSGNLSKGGLRTNCECGVFVSNPSALAALSDWFGSQFDGADPLTEDMIAAYEPDYKKAKKKSAELAKHQKETEKKLKAVGEPSFSAWKRALDLAEAYYRDKGFGARDAKRTKADGRMLDNLNPPQFDFDRTAWEKFYAEGVLGQLNPIYRDRVFNAGTKLRSALHALKKTPESAVRHVLGQRGKLRIKGFRVNSASKILASFYPTEWPVYNSRVALAMADFGYTAPRGIGVDGRYIVFRNTMKKFMAACKERGLQHVDAISLDAFFYDRSEELGY